MQVGDGEPGRLRPLLLRHAAVARPPVPVRRAARHGDRPRHHRPLPPRRPRGRLRRALAVAAPPPPAGATAAAAAPAADDDAPVGPPSGLRSPSTTGAARSTCSRGCSRTSRSRTSPSSCATPSRCRRRRSRRCPPPSTSPPSAPPSCSPALARRLSRAAVYSLGAAVRRRVRRLHGAAGGARRPRVGGVPARRRAGLGEHDVHGHLRVVAGRPHRRARLVGRLRLRLDVAARQALERRRDLRDPGASPGPRRGRAARLHPPRPRRRLRRLGGARRRVLLAAPPPPAARAPALAGRRTG